MKKPTSALIAGLLVIAAAPTAAALEEKTARTWAGAATLAGEDGSLWQPTYRAGVRRDGPISVTTDVGDDSNQNAMNVFAQFGDESKGFTIEEKFADYQWAAEPAFDRAIAPVGSVEIELGDPGTQITITAEVWANCYLPKNTENPPPPPDNFTCNKGDVKRFGGVLTMTAEPPSTMTAPGTTDIVIQSEGINYAQLVRIASSLQQVMG